MQKNHYIRLLLVVVCVGLIPLLPSLASAESYVGAQFGFTIPEDLGGVFPTGGGARISNLDLNNAFAYGVKGGHYFDRYKWLGVEADFYTTNPNIENQNATATPGGPFIQQGNLMRVSTLAFSLMARYPGEKFQPYAGLGMGIYFAKSTQSFNKDTDTSPGFHLVGGARFFVTKELALFGEYKYDRATFSFPTLAPTGIIGDYYANTFMVGVSYHFMPEGK